MIQAYRHRSTKEHFSLPSISFLLNCEPNSSQQRIYVPNSPRHVNMYPNCYRYSDSPPPACPPLRAVRFDSTKKRTYDNMNVCHSAQEFPPITFIPYERPKKRLISIGDREYDWVIFRKTKYNQQESNVNSQNFEGKEKKQHYLPTECVKLMKKWLKEHNPYPTSEEKEMICKKTGLSFSQVGNWFANQRKKIARESPK